MPLRRKLYLSLIAISVICTTVIAFDYHEKETSQSMSSEEELVHYVGTSMMDLPLEYIGDKAKYAIVGNVIALNPVVYTDPDLAEQKRLATSTGDDTIFYDRTILTDVTFRVEEDLFGEYTNQTITVRVPGGSIPGYTTIYDSAPTFEVDKRYTVFVGNGQSYMISSDHFVVLGLMQGTIKMDDIEESKFANSETTEQDIKDKIKSLKKAEI